MSEDDFYSVLGVARTATIKEIKERFRFLSHAYHPDKFATEAQRRSAEHEFKRINQAHQVLSDPTQRARYDASQPHSSRSSAQRASQPPSTPPNESKPSAAEAAPWRVPRPSLWLFIALITVVFPVIWITLRVWHRPALTLAVPGKGIRLSPSDWTAMQNSEDYAQNFEARHQAKNEVFPQVVTVFLIQMSSDRKLGTKISDNEYVEFFTSRPGWVVIQVRREKQAYWLLSRQTFALPPGAPVSGGPFQAYSESEITELRRWFQNETDRTRSLLSETF